MTIKIHDVAIYMTGGSNVKYYGLFARINSEGTAIKNLGIINHTIDLECGTIPPSINFYVGSLAALVTKGDIENCFSAGGKINVNLGRAYTVNGASQNKSVEVGGLVGNHNGDFTRCHNTSDIYVKMPESGIAYGAGIAATVSHAQIKECYNTGNLTAHTMKSGEAYPIISKWCAIYVNANSSKYIVGCATSGGTNVSGRAWQKSTWLGRPTLKWNPDESVPKAAVSAV